MLWLTEGLPRVVLSSKRVLRRSGFWIFELGGLVHMLCIVTEHAAAKSVATVLLDFRAHPETAGPLA